VTIRLGLIGDNIKRSRSPLLHRLAGRLCGLDVSYEPLIPADLGLSFDAAFDRCSASGFRGINITYPYKERVFARLTVDDPRIRRIGACNTVHFAQGLALGYNTDYTGFIGAFRASFARQLPGHVAIAGAGGVGKAVAFALAELGARHIRLFDLDPERAAALIGALREAAPAMRAEAAPTIEEAAVGADGLVNCTPLGMVGIPGTAIPLSLMRQAAWAFDAVYTPVETEFLSGARAAGLAVMSGYELFFHQGVDAFTIFTGHAVDMDALRSELAKAEIGEAA
jgi:shikimate dehydrogenase